MSRAALPPAPDVRWMRRALDSWPHDFLTVMEDLVAHHGDVVRLAFGVPTRYLCTHPDAVHQILVGERDNFAKAGADNEVIRGIVGTGLLTSEGRRWRRLRTAAAPHFRPAQLARYADIVAAECEALIARWTPTEITTIDVYPEMLGFTLRVLGRALFDRDLSPVVDELASAFQVLNAEVTRDPTIPALPWWWGRARYRAALRTIDGICADIARGPDGLLAALADGPAAASGHAKNFLFAGHATTTSLLSFGLHVLASEPDVARRATAEVDAAIGARPPRAADLPALGELHRIGQETLRRYSPVWHMPYQCKQATVIGGYRIPARAIVSISPYLLHRRADLWPEPRRFDPDRFLADRVRARSPYAYIPFGIGARRCIGARLSAIELGLVLAAVIQRFTVEPVDHAPLRCLPILTFRPDPRFRVRLRRRASP